MLTGRRTFQGATRTAKIAANLNEEPEPPSKVVPDLPRKVERWVTRCLRKDLDRRSQSMAEVRVALQDLKEALVFGPAKRRSRILAIPSSSVPPRKTRPATEARPKNGPAGEVSSLASEPRRRKSIGLACSSLCR